MEDGTPGPGSFFLPRSDSEKGSLGVGLNRKLRIPGRVLSHSGVESPYLPEMGLNLKYGGLRTGNVPGRGD